MSILGGAEERREASVRIERGKTQPVERSFLRDEGCTAHVPDQGMIFDPRRRTLPLGSSWL
jgi:hypothetical protein